MKKVLILLSLIIFSVNISLAKDVNSTDKIVQRGCCSHHGGVCGCSYGRSRCCDGQLSPSCNCMKDDKKIGLCNAKKSTNTFNINKR